MANLDKCDSCGGALTFDPGTKSLKCVNCGKTFAISSKILEGKHPLSMVGQIEEPATVAPNSTVKCLSCGAMVGGGETTCPYCGSSAFEGKDLSLKPDGIIPFSFDESGVRGRFIESLKNRKFLPNDFKTSPPELTIEPLYIPAYSFDLGSLNEYYGKLSDKVEGSSGETIYKDFTIRGSKYYESEDMLYECSKYLSQKTLDGIKPFDLSVAKVYDPSFIKGYSVEIVPSGALSTLANRARDAHESSARERILMDYHYTSVRHLEVTPQYLKSQYSYVVLPTYKISYTYKTKKHVSFMNGQTGKVTGSVPRSVVKILVTTLLSVLGVGCIALLIYLLVTGKLG